MARIRKIEIQNYRCIKALTWTPSPGVNCLIGPGDSGKSTVLDAIDVCLTSRRSVQFSDTDFYQLDVSAPISISITLGELDDALKRMDVYALVHRNFNAETGVVEDEPEKDGEPVLTLRLAVGSDLEPSWTLVSDRAQALNQQRSMAQADRIRLSPTRIGTVADYNLGWRHGSILNRLSEEPPDASAALIKAARDARTTFGDEAEKELQETLRLVTSTARELGVFIGERARAMLDAHAVSITGGGVSLHDQAGVPLRRLGLGSTRLLVAGLQRAASAQSTIILADELEHGLEPHRILRFLTSLGAKEHTPPLQVFVTTHSPVAIRELSGNQLLIIRPLEDRHDIKIVGEANDIQGTIRSCPEALLSDSVIVCEGATEVGFVRGLDLHRTSKGLRPIGALGVSIVDGGGGTKPLRRAVTLRSLGYRSALLRDSDVQPSEEGERAFCAQGGKIICWRSGRTLEDELFQSLTISSVMALVDRAIDIRGAILVGDHITSASNGGSTLVSLRAEFSAGSISPETRAILGKAARCGDGWFKSITAMEAVAHDIVGPDLRSADQGFCQIVDQIFEWIGQSG